MRFCPIVPIKYLDQLAGLSNSQMVLAHWLVDKLYLEFYKKRVKDGDFVILDNGACELKTSIPAEDLLEAYQRLGGCDVLVIPDSGENNMELFKAFIDAKPELKISKKTKLMAVPHCIRDLSVMLGYSNEVGIIGLNRDFEAQGRGTIIDKYQDWGRQFHLLGIKKNPVEEILAVKPFKSLVSGIDSSFPFRLFSRGRRIEEARPYPKHDSMYADGLSPEIMDFCVREFKTFLEWINE